MNGGSRRHCSRPHRGLEAGDARQERTRSVPRHLPSRRFPRATALVDAKAAHRTGTIGLSCASVRTRLGQEPDCALITGASPSPTTGGGAPCRRSASRSCTARTRRRAPPSPSGPGAHRSVAP